MLYPSKQMDRRHSRRANKCLRVPQGAKALNALFALFGFVSAMLVLPVFLIPLGNNNHEKETSRNKHFPSSSLLWSQQWQLQRDQSTRNSHETGGFNGNTDTDHQGVVDSSLVHCPTWPPKLVSLIKNMTARKPPPLIIPDHIEVLFSPTREDRSGSAILDMLFAHAFSFAYGRKYGGACGTSPFSEDYQRMIQVLGLQGELMYNPPTCPGNNIHLRNNSMVLPKDIYRDWKNVRIFTEEWLCHIQQIRRASGIRQAQQSQSQQHGPLQRDTDITNGTSKTKHVVVHIRRGDVTPCSKVIRYLPNLHYLRLLDLYANNNNTRVTIFTEMPEVDCSEDFQPFLNRGMKMVDGSSGWQALQAHQELAPKVLLVNVDMEMVWHTMLFDADVLILSKSAFSFVPAMFSKASTVVFSKFFFGPLPHWQLTPREIVMETNRVTAQVKRECCHNLTS